PQRGLPDGARDADVVLLDEDRRIEAGAVRRRASHLDGILLEEAQQRRRLARVADARARSLHRVDEAPGESGDAARVLEEIEGDALGGEEGAGASGHGAEDGTGKEAVAVPRLRFPAAGGIQ